MTAEDEVCNLLYELEVSLLLPEVRRDRKRVASLLEVGFREFGSSGRVYDLGSVLAMMAAEPELEPVRIEEFAIERFGETAVLATYLALRGEHRTLRSSLWRMSGGRWRMVFHQGTLCG